MPSKYPQENPQKNNYTPPQTNRIFGVKVTYSENNVVCVGETFTQACRIINLGSQTWKNMYLQCLDKKNNTPSSRRLKLIHDKVLIPETKVGEAANITIIFKAPNQPFSVQSEWAVVSHSGKVNSSDEGKICFVIEVLPK